MSQLHYVTGDATAPVLCPAVIAHVCNDSGGWGRGFVLALSGRWPEPERSYRAWFHGRYEDENPFRLGAVQFVHPEFKVWVANMVGQHGTHPHEGVPPIRYDAIEEALGNVRRFAWLLSATVHMPRIGCGLAGGDWESIEPIVFRTLIDHEQGVDVYVHDLPR